MSLSYAVVADNVVRAAQEARKVLEGCRHPVAVGDAPHVYTDKFSVAEFVVAAGADAMLVGLHNLGMDATSLKTAHTWAQERRVQLEFQHTEKCTFRRRLTKEHGARGKHASEIRGVRGTLQKLTGVISTVELYEWDYVSEWRVCLVAGADTVGTRTLAEGVNKNLVTTCDNEPPYEAHTSDAPISADLTWLLRALNAEMEPVFYIDRTSSACHTPRRNREVADALECFCAMGGWGCDVHDYFMDSIFDSDSEHDHDLSMCCASIFSPALPLLQQAVPADQAPQQPDGKVATTSEDNAQPAELLSASDRVSLVLASKRGLLEGLSTISLSYPTAGGITSASATVAYLGSYLGSMHDSITEGLDYIELLLREQLVRAIGRHVTSRDFAEYMSYHCRKLFVAAAAPHPFSYPVRQAGCDPVGTLELVRGPQEIETVVRCAPAPRGGTRFALDATTEVVFHGPRYLHAHCTHRFSTEDLGPASLRCRARQFGSYIVVLGVVSGPDTFIPHHAVLLQSRDDLSIPLDLEEIPSAKEFHKAVESLSPEQRRFAQAYRSMQMEATLFAVCVVQVKPQIEAVLNLPQGSLAKEVALSQQLMELFTAQHIASDLLAYRPDGTAPASVRDKVACVRRKADGISTFVAAAKQHQVDELLEKERLRKEAKASRKREEAYASFDFSACYYGGGGGGGGGEYACLPEKCSSGAIHLHKATLKKKKSFMPSLPSISLPSISLRKKEEDDTKLCEAAPQSICSTGKAGAAEDAHDTAPEEGEAEAEPDADGDAEADADADTEAERGGASAGQEVVEEDISQLPDRLEQQLARIEDIACLRPTTIKVGAEWQRQRTKGLLGSRLGQTLLKEDLESERAHAFAVLSALTKSGELPLVSAELHVVTVVTHCFDETVMDTAVKRSVNPVEQVEAAMLLTASTVLAVPVKDLVKAPPVCPACPALFE